MLKSRTNGGRLHAFTPHQLARYLGYSTARWIRSHIHCHLNTGQEKGQREGTLLSTPSRPPPHPDSATTWPDSLLYVPSSDLIVYVYHTLNFFVRLYVIFCKCMCVIISECPYDSVELLSCLCVCACVCTIYECVYTCACMYICMYIDLCKYVCVCINIENRRASNLQLAQLMKKKKNNRTYEVTDTLWRCLYICGPLGVWLSLSSPPDTCSSLCPNILSYTEPTAN